MAFLARVSAAVALALAAARAAAPGGCSVADDEGDGVGLLQSAGHGARVQPESLPGWAPREARCKIAEKQCGSGCCRPQDTCTSDQECEFVGKTSPPTPAEVGCPIAYKDLGDDGCCPAGTFLGPPETCVAPTCENILQYNCSITSGGSPTCTEGGEWPTGAHSNTFVNGVEVTPTVTETCTLDGKSCYKYEIQRSKLTQTGQTAPDCNAA